MTKLNTYSNEKNGTEFNDLDSITNSNLDICQNIPGLLMGHATIQEFSLQNNNAILNYQLLNQLFVPKSIQSNHNNSTAITLQQQLLLLQNDIDRLQNQYEYNHILLNSLEEMNVNQSNNELFDHVGNPSTIEMHFPEIELSCLLYNETSWKHNNILSSNNDDLSPSPMNYDESHQIPNQNLAFFQDTMERLDYNIEDNNLFTNETEAVRSFL